MAPLIFDYTRNFRDLGKFVGIFNRIRDWKGEAFELEEEVSQYTNVHPDEIESLRTLLTACQEGRESLQTFRQAVAAACSSGFVRRKLRKDLRFTGTLNNVEILRTLRHQMVLDGETIQQNTVTIGDIIYDPDNAGNGTLSLNSVTQLPSSESYTLECLSASGTVGVDFTSSWKIYGQIADSIKSPDEFWHGAITGSFTCTDTPAAADVENAQGEILFNITLNVGAVGWAAGDKVRFTTAAVDLGKFQSFFRDVYGIIMPASNAPTIPDVWSAPASSSSSSSQSSSSSSSSSSSKSSSSSSSSKSSSTSSSKSSSS